MQVGNSTNLSIANSRFADSGVQETLQARQQSFQELTPEQRNQRADQALDARNSVQEAVNQTQTDNRTRAASLFEIQQTQTNIDTYTQVFTNATGGSASSRSGGATATDVRELNETINRNNTLQSGIPQDIFQRLNEQPSGPAAGIPTQPDDPQTPSIQPVEPGEPQEPGATQGSQSAQNTGATQQAGAQTPTDSPNQTDSTEQTDSTDQTNSGPSISIQGATNPEDQLGQFINTFA